MWNKLFKREKLNNAGFTLVELLCALALLAIVGLSVTGFVMMSTRTYGTATEQVDVQYEAQQAMNQLKEMVLDANRGVNMYTTYIPDDSDEVQLLSNPYFVIYNQETNADGTYSYPVIKILYDSSEQSLYYGRKVFDSITAINVTDSVAFPADSLLAQNVASFNVDTSNIRNNQVRVMAEFISGSATVELNPVVSLRNKVVASPNLDSIYESAPIEHVGYVYNVFIYKEGDSTNSITTDTVIRSLSTDVTVTYTAKVEAKDLGTDVEWKLEGSSQDEFGNFGSYVSDGVLTITPSETSDTLTLIASSQARPEKNARVIIQTPSYDPEAGYVNSVSIDSEVTGVGGNGYKDYTFTAHLTYRNEKKVKEPVDLRGCTWAVKDAAGNAVEGVTISSTDNTDTNDSNDEGTSTVVLHCTDKAANKKIFVTATSKAKNTQDEYVTAIFSRGIGDDGFNIDNIVVANYEPVIEWGSFSTTLSRNSKPEISINIANMTVNSVTWSLVYEDGFDTRNRWGSYYTSRTTDDPISSNLKLTKDTTNVQANLSGSGYIAKNTIEVAPRLDWKTEFKFTVKVRVQGKSGGATVDRTIDKKFTVKPVSINLEKTTGVVSQVYYPYREYTYYVSGDIYFSVTVNNYDNPENIAVKLYPNNDEDSYELYTCSDGNGDYYISLDRERFGYKKVNNLRLKVYMPGSGGNDSLYSSSVLQYGVTGK